LRPAQVWARARRPHGEQHQYEHGADREEIRQMPAQPRLGVGVRRRPSVAHSTVAPALGFTNEQLQQALSADGRLVGKQADAVLCCVLWLARQR
jgi:hypothetical protein